MKRSTHLTERASTKQPVLAAGGRGVDGLGQTLPNQGAPLIDNNEVTVSVVGANRNADGSGVMTLQVDTSPTFTMQCWAGFIGLVDTNGNLLGYVSLGEGFGTCFYTKQIRFNPPATEEVQLYFWWDQDTLWDTATGEFGDTPTFEDQIEFGETPPRFKSPTFPLVSTEEGRETGYYQEPQPTVGSFLGNTAQNVGNTLRQVAIWSVVIVGGGAILWYGGPIISAVSEQTGQWINTEEKSDSEEDPPQLPSAAT